MKINFDTVNNQNVDKVTTSQNAPSFYKLDKTGGIALDISGIVMDNTAYGDHGRTAEDVMQEAGSQFNVGTLRDYMTVMSNSMSAEDFNQMMEDGFDPSKMDADKVVTIVDHIKAEMAKSGEVVAGYNDNLSSEKLTQITGNQAYAQKLKDAMSRSDIPVTAHNAKEVKNAAQKAESIESFSDGSVKYMVENNLEPTIENIYLASYSAAGDGSKQPKGYYAQEMPGYFARKADDINWQQLSGQVEKTVSDMDIEEISQDEKIQNAKWLIEKGIPVTQKAMEKLVEIRSITFPITNETALQAAVNAISNGKSAVQGNLISDKKTVYEQAVEIKEQTDSITDDAVWQVVSEEKDYNLNNLAAAQNNSNISDTADVTDASFITARRMLEEVRLQMTIDANTRLLKNGVAIDTLELSDLVEQLKQQETAIKGQLFDETNADAVSQKSSLYETTNSILKEIPYLPAAVLGRAAAQTDASLTYVYDNGLQIKAKLEAAGSAYETLMTSPRKDMGDSIQKAFQNVDDILADLELDTTYENQKAVRSLAYNSQTITKESIEKVKIADKQIENVVKSMTPGKTLELIREGKNPLTMSLTELEQSLHNMEMQPVEETEKFSKYLYQLEQNKEITEAERGAYIGVYRLFHQIEKSDGAAVSSLVSQGAELTLGNLLSAVRSRKANIDVIVDNAFGMQSDVVSKGTSISKQIEDGVLEAKLSHQIYKDINVEGLQKLTITRDTTMEEIADVLKEDISESSENNYKKDILQQVRNAQNVEDTVLQTLKAYEEPVNVNQIMAADALINDQGNVYFNSRKYAGKMDESFVENLIKASKEVIDNFTDKENASQAYAKLTNVMSSIFSEATDSVIDNTIDLKAISLCHKQLSLMSSLSQKESYEIPVTIGEGVTSIHLFIQHDEEAKGIVEASFETLEYGKVTAQFTQANNKISAIFTSDVKDGLKKLEAVKEVMEQNLETEGMEMQEANFILGNPKDSITLLKQNADNNNETVSNRELYRLAKSFLTAFQSVKTEGESI